MKVDVHPEPRSSSDIINYANKLRNKALADSTRNNRPNLKYDEVCCVFDVDDRPGEKVAEAIAKARKSGLNVALSNPCFELWLLLHLRDRPGALTHKQAPSMLRKYVPDYHKKVDFSTYRGGYTQAVKHAIYLDEAANESGEPGRNPTTGVYKLTELIARPEGETGGASTNR